jgi:serine/threonine protein kinase/tetratricopeptide (TPR) repeat protein
MQTNLDKARELFLHAVGKLPPGAWAAYVADACGPDTELQRQVMHFLHVHLEAGSFLEHPAVSLEHPAVSLEPTGAFTAMPEGDLPGEGPGTVIGPYKLLQQIGEGGMGTVYMAQQTETVKRMVALKVIKPGMDSRQVVARFEAERQALALMDHPNIARVFDGGATTTGRPYFVMELVRGVPITNFCDENRLGVRERLELFVSVCQAVQHAHQKGIIHRDLKPSNVLVTWHDDKAVVKVIDFGIAKATGQQLTDKTLFTAFAQMIGTPLYMSPEQAQLSGLDVDTRSDVYSLGVLLYELLTGTTPFDRERLRTVGFDEIRRIIREEEPARPSTRLSTLGQAASTASANRKSDPRRLSRLLRGELDWIVMKALEKDRNRRYESASAFAADVQRHLHNEPVLACPPSVGYRLRKFLRRYKGPVLAASAILFLLAAGIVGTTIGLLWALAAEREMRTQRDQKDAALRDTKKERDQKEEARRDAVAAAEEETRARRQTQRALNMMTDEMVEEHLGQQPQVTGRQREFLKKVLAEHEVFAAARADDAEGRKSRAEGYFHVGRIRLRLGEHEEGMAAFSAAAAIWKQLQSDFPDRPEYRFNEATCYRMLGILRRDTGRLKDAESAFNDALTILKPLAADFKHRPEFRFQLAVTHVDLGILLKETSDRLKEAEEHYDAAVPLFAELVKELPKEPQYRHGLAFGHNNRGSLMWATNKDKKAESDFRTALDIRKQLVKDVPERIEYRQNLALSYNNLGTVLRANLQLKEAESAYRAALDIRKELAAQFPGRPDLRYDLALSYFNLGNLLRKLVRLKEAESAYLDALPILEDLVKTYPNRPDFRQRLASVHNGLALVLKETGRPKDAEAAYGDALTVQRKLVADFDKVPDYHNELAGTLGNLARLLLENKEFDAAAPLLDEALPHNRAAVAANRRNPDYGRYYRNNLWALCQCELALGDHARLAMTAETLAQLGYLGNADVYFGSQFLARCVGLAEKDSQLDEAGRMGLTQNYTDRALVLLRQAVAGGSIDAAGMRKDRQYDAIREREGFKKLLAELEEKGKK